MDRFFLNSKLHGATVTQSDLHYEGSLSMDEDFMEQAGIMENEQVCVYNVNNGARFTTYAIKAPRGSKIIGTNGACSRMVMVGDKVIICTYAAIPIIEIQSHQPKVLLFNNNNSFVIKDNSNKQAELKTYAGSQL